MKFKLEKKELMFAAIGVAVILTWFLWVQDLILPHLENIFPFFAMLIYQSGIFIGLAFISTILNTTKTRIKASIIAFMILVGEDVIMAPFIVGKDGVINHAVTYWYASTDAGFASLWSLILPNSFVWFFTYVVTSVLLMFVIPIIIANPKFIRKVWD